eukprot:4925851-Pyramimonas_sp.AAC.1
MSKESIIGGLGAIKKDRPISSAETLRPGQRENIEDALSPLGYSFDRDVGSNSMFRLLLVIRRFGTPANRALFPFG